MNGQSRIAELRLISREQTDRNAAVAVAVDTALQSPESCELIGWTAEPRMRHALEANGFRPRDRRAIFVQDPRKLIAAETGPWDLTLLDDDSAFLNFPDFPYAT